MAGFRLEDNKCFEIAWFALFTTRKGIINFVCQILRLFVRNSRKVIAQADCGKCTLVDLLACPTAGFCKIANSKCDKHESVKQAQKKCPTGVCDKLVKCIRDNHRFYKKDEQEPSWNNTDSTKWSSDVWQIAKCYLPPTGYGKADTPDNTDFNGLLNVIFNMKIFGNYVDFAACKDARKAVNGLRHVSDAQDINRKTLQQTVDTFMTLLNDDKLLNGDTNAIVATERIQKAMRKNDLYDEDQPRDDKRKLEEDNWVKAQLAARCIKSILLNIIEFYMKEFQEGIKKDTGHIECNDCYTENVVPCNEKTRFTCVLNKGKCSFHKSPSRQPKECPKMVCNKWYEAIKKINKYKTAAWARTKANRWNQDYMQIAKCFLPQDIGTTDLFGCLHIITSCTIFDKEIVNGDMEVFQKTKKEMTNVNWKSRDTLTDTQYALFLRLWQSLLTCESVSRIHKTHCKSFVTVSAEASGYIKELIAKVPSVEDVIAKVPSVEDGVIESSIDSENEESDMNKDPLEAFKDSIQKMLIKIQRGQENVLEDVRNLLENCN